MFTHEQQTTMNFTIVSYFNGLNEDSHKYTYLSSSSVSSDASLEDK